MILCQTVAELFDPLPAVLCTFMQYSIAFCSPQEAASDVISGVAIDDNGMDDPVKCGYSRSNRS